MTTQSQHKPAPSQTVFEKRPRDRFPLAKAAWDNFTTLLGHIPQRMVEGDGRPNRHDWYARGPRKNGKGVVWWYIDRDTGRAMSDDIPELSTLADNIIHQLAISHSIRHYKDPTALKDHFAKAIESGLFTLNPPNGGCYAEKPVRGCGVKTFHEIRQWAISP